MILISKRYVAGIEGYLRGNEGADRGSLTSCAVMSEMPAGLASDRIIGARALGWPLLQARQPSRSRTYSQTN